MHKSCKPHKFSTHAVCDVQGTVVSEAQTSKCRRHVSTTFRWHDLLKKDFAAMKVFEVASRSLADSSVRKQEVPSS